MWDFKFDAPEYHNFFRKQKQNSEIKLDPSNQNDLWFMQQHVQLTPIKLSKKQQSQQKYQLEKKGLMNKSLSSIQQQKHTSNSISRNNNKNRQKPMKKIEPKQVMSKLKRVNISEKYNNNCVQQSTRSLSLSSNQLKKEIKFVPSLEKVEQQIKNSKISKTKSQSSLQNGFKKKLRIPCPYPLRVQRQWETKSHKNWYNLTQQSAKKAMQSMKKFCFKERKSPKKQNLRFKF